MKICHIITSLDVGGAELVLFRLLSAQSTNANNITVITLKAGGALALELQRLGFTVHTLNVSGLSSLLFSVFKLAKMLKSIQPDIVQSWLYHADFISALSSFYWRAPHYVWGIHTCQLPKGKVATWAIMKACARLSYFVPDKIVCVAEAARQLHLTQGYCADKFAVIPNGFSLNDYKAKPAQRELLRQELGIAPSATAVGIVARWHPDKGQDVLLRAISKIQQHYANVVFVFVGRGCDKHNQELVTLTSHCAFPDNILAVGERSDIPAILNSLDVFCMPSRTEAFPLALGEAMCAALPVVATAVGDVQYMTGNLVSLAMPDNADALATQLTQILALTPAQRTELGQALLARVSTLFSIETMVARYQKLYAELPA